MRVLVIAACPLPWPRGTPIRIHRTAEAVVRRGHDVHVATYPRGDDTVAVPYQLHRVGSSRTNLKTAPGPSLKKLIWLDPLLCRKVKNLLMGEPFDVVHAHHYEGLIAALCARRLSRPVPIVYDAHTLLATELPYYRLPMPTRAVTWLGTALDRQLPPRADQIIAVTQRMQDWFLEFTSISAERLSLIANGVEHEHFSQPNASSDQTPAATRRPPRIVFAGNLAEYQGIGLLLSAFARLREIETDARLVLITESAFAGWDEQVRALGIGDGIDVMHADYASLPAHLHDAEVLANPRIECEGIPQKLLNYMAAGKPIVSFAGSAAVLKHEQTALLVPDADVGAFARALLRLLREPDLGRALGDAARRHVIAEHGWPHVAECVEAVYARAMSAHGAEGRVP